MVDKEQVKRAKEVKMAVELKKEAEKVGMVAEGKAGDGIRVGIDGETEIVKEVREVDKVRSTIRR